MACRHAQDRDHSKWAVTFAGEVTSRPGLYRASRAVKVCSGCARPACKTTLPGMALTGTSQGVGSTFRVQGLVCLLLWN